MNASSMVKNQADQAPMKNTASNPREAAIRGNRRAGRSSEGAAATTSASIAVISPPWVDPRGSATLSRAGSDQRAAGAQALAQVVEVEVEREPPQWPRQPLRDGGDRRHQDVEAVLPPFGPRQAHLFTELGRQEASRHEPVEPS